jgi:hypothetical protein
MKTQINFRASNLTKEQIDELMAYLNETQEGIVATAVDRMWHEEIPLFRRNEQTLVTGDLIGVGPGYNTHGCRDMAVLRYLGDGKATVIEAESCHSCWQVGHDADHVFITIGEKFRLDPNKVVLAGVDWSSQIKWEAGDSLDWNKFTE